MTRQSIALYFMAARVFVPAHGATAQSLPDTAQVVYTAAQYVVGQEAQRSLLPSKANLVVDVEGRGFEGMALSPKARAAATKPANDLGGRPGRLQSVMSCSKEPPTPEEYKKRGRCWFLGQVENVLQVSEPTFSGDSAFVWITVYHQGINANGERGRMAAEGRQVILIRHDGSDWVAVGTRTGSAAVF